jgi:hypothetical protein
MSRTNKYYLPQAVAVAERRLEKLHLRQRIAVIDEQLLALEAFKYWYPSHRADDEQPCALHTAALP